MLKLITSLFTNFASIEDNASPKQELRFQERFEARAGWVTAVWPLIGLPYLAGGHICE
jgi:hypothetical protein